MIVGPYPKGLKLGPLTVKELEKLAERNFLIHTYKYGIDRSLSSGRPHESFIPMFINPYNLTYYAHYWEMQKDRLRELVYELELR